MYPTSGSGIKASLFFEFPSVGARATKWSKGFRKKKLQLVECGLLASL